MNIILTRSHYSDSTWELFNNAPPDSQFMLREEGVYLIKTATDKLAALPNVLAHSDDIQLRGLHVPENITACSIATWLEEATTDTPWVTF